MTIDKIFNDGNLSVRSYHACKYEEIETISELKDYYSKHQSFTRFRNCGKKSNLELIELCKKYRNNNSLENQTKVDESIVTIIQNLKRPQRQIINQFIKITTSELKVRGKNAITQYIGKSLKLNDFLTKIFNREDFQISKIRNIGKGYIGEIEAYLNKIESFILKVSDIDNDNELTSLNNKFLIQNTFSINDIPDNVLQSQSILKLCQFLIEKKAFFKDYYNDIFIKSLNIYKNSLTISLDEIASELKYSRERIRQIRQRCFEELNHKISFLKNFEDDFYQNYEIDRNEEFIILSNDKVDEINFLYETDFTKNFINYIFSIYLSEQFTIIGNIEDILIPKQSSRKNRHEWKNIYLVNKEINKEININKLCEDISFRLREKVNESYKFNFKSYLSRFLATNNFNILEEIKDFCEIIVNEEFGLFLDLEENLIFRRNTKKLSHEYAYEALEQLGTPSKVNDIYLKIVDLFPNFYTNADKVRASLKRQNGFVPIGRKSVYGLQKWENELDNFKGGTIRSIVKEYLDNISTPQHISEITKYVLQYRPKTNEYSILQNLKLDESKMFKFFKNSTIGASGKIYDNSFSVLDNKSTPIKKSWDESYKMLISFIAENDRLPYSSNCPIGEEKLYRWLTVQKVKIKKNLLNKNRVSLIQELIKTAPKPIIRTKGTYTFNDLLDFTQKNKRLPKPHLKEEQRLYNFFYRKRKLYDKNELTNEQYEIIEKMLRQFSRDVKSKTRVQSQYETLLEFIRENKRLPSANFRNELTLYHFFYKQRKLFEKNELGNDLIPLFLSVTREFKNIKYENTRNQT